jgi:hypothetical protein
VARWRVTWWPSAWWPAGRPPGALLALRVPAGLEASRPRGLVAHRLGGRWPGVLVPCGPEGPGGLEAWWPVVTCDLRGLEVFRPGDPQATRWPSRLSDPGGLVGWWDCLVACCLCGPVACRPSGLVALWPWCLVASDPRLTWWSGGLVI